MSILQEYEAIRKEMGEAKYHRIERFLEENPTFSLSDVYYNEAVYKLFEKKETRYLAEDHEKRIEEIIEANKAYRFNAAATELEARKMFNGHDLSINKAFQNYTSEELREAVDLMASRSCTEEEQRMNATDTMQTCRTSGVRTEEEIRSALNKLGDVSFFRRTNGEVIWPIEALKAFNEKELGICKNIIFPDSQNQPMQKNGGISR